MKLRFDTHGNEKQKLCAREWVNPNVTDIVYGGSKGAAKSYTGCSLIFGDALIYPKTHYFIARKKLNDLRKHTRPSIEEVFTHWGVTPDYWHYNGSDNYYELYNDSKVFLLQAKYEPSDPDYTRFGSMQMTRGWIEEAGEFEKDAVVNLMAAVGRWNNDKHNLNGKVLQTCNPAKNYLYKDYYKLFKAGELEAHKRFIQALPSDNKRLPKGYLENLNRILNTNQKKRLLYGDWEYDDDPNALCEYDDILSIFENDHVPKTGNKYLTADVARFGSDKAIVGVWDGWVLIEVVAFEKSSTTQIQDCINHLRQKHGIPKKRCIADEDGVGGGVVDNCGILGFVNNATPIDTRKKSDKKDNQAAPNYNNLQSQCCYYLAEMINDYEIHIEAELSNRDREHIVEELEQLKTHESDGVGKLKILPKELIKGEIGRSPDWRDMLMMRAFFDIGVKYSGNNFVA